MGGGFASQRAGQDLHLRAFCLCMVQARLPTTRRGWKTRECWQCGAPSGSRPRGWALSGCHLDLWGVTALCRGSAGPIGQGLVEKSSAGPARPAQGSPELTGQHPLQRTRQRHLGTHHRFVPELVVSAENRQVQGARVLKLTDTEVPHSLSVGLTVSGVASAPPRPVGISYTPGRVRHLACRLCSGQSQNSECFQI